ncbi:Transposase IS4 [Popillia japonica]|uniref:Transposase IS4 n=1 Tax=Popillia japonica TaxID=7064 RepID=A0AAW1HUL5_POPJA
MDKATSDQLYDLLDTFPTYCEDDSEADENVVDYDNDVEAQNDLESDDDTFCQPSVMIGDRQLLAPEDRTKESLPEPEKSKSTYSTRKLSWGKKKLEKVPQTFCGNTDLAPEILQLETPYQYFKFFLDDVLMDRIVHESVKFSAQKDPPRPFQMSVIDLKDYLGICLITSVVSISDVRLYWNETVGPDIIRNTMTVNHFEKIRSNLHFNDNETAAASVANRREISRFSGIFNSKRGKKSKREFFKIWSEFQKNQNGNFLKSGPNSKNSDESYKKTKKNFII